MSRQKTAFDKTKVIGSLHTGGPVALASDGRHVITCVGEEAILTRLSDGWELRRFIADSETIHSLSLTPSCSHLAIFTASLSCHIFEEPLSLSSSKSVSPSRSINRAHDAPVHVCLADPTSTLLASGSADGVVKVWDIKRGFLTHIFKGHGGVVSALLFRYLRDTNTAVNTEPEVHLISASVDTRIRLFDLSASSGRAGSSRPIAVLEGHVSVPRGLDLTTDGRWLISGGRDSVVLLWDLYDGSSSNQHKGLKHGKLAPSLVKTIPILERVEAVGWVSNSPDSMQFFTAGESGLVKIWDACTGASLYALKDGLSDTTEQQFEILCACCLRDQSIILSVHADQNILVHSVSNKALIQQLVGFNDEVTASSFLSTKIPDSHVAVAANSSLIRVYSVEGNNARLLPGHSAIVLCLDSSVNRRYLASGSKDNSARLWSFSESLSTWINVAVCEGHAESVGAVALSRKIYKPGYEVEAPHFMFTGSQDRTIKMWDLSSVPKTASSAQSPLRCKSLTTQKVHEKDINSLDVSPGDRLLASGSQDRTAKVFEIDCSPASTRGEIRLVGTCKGHKRGVWTVKFGSVERVLATGSGDKTIKLWNLGDFSCIKTFEGHTNSVLQVKFLNHDLQLASTASDGLLKVWNTRAEECVVTMDNHVDKVWALDVSSDESMVVTGGADSVVTIWRDCTAERESERQADLEKSVLKEQDLMNYMAMRDYQKAISVAITMNQPGRLFSLFREIVSPTSYDLSRLGKGSILGNTNVDQMLLQLPPVELSSLLRHIRDWNANAKTSPLAQIILNAILKLRSMEDIIGAIESSKNFLPVDASADKPNNFSLNDLVQALIPYTERHLSRLDRLVQDSYVLDYILEEMDVGLVDGG